MSLEISTDGPRKRHELYYFPNADTIILIEDTLYKVHRFILHNSRPFLDIIDGVKCQELSDEHAIRLEGIACVDWDRFLAVFYNRDPCDLDRNTVASWTSVLEMSLKWELNDMRDLAVKWLSIVAPLARQIIIAHQHDLASLLLSARIRICERDEPLSVDEARQLGIDETWLIVNTREKVRDYGVRSPFDAAKIEMLEKVYMKAEQDKHQSGGSSHAAEHLEIPGEV